MPSLGQHQPSSWSRRLLWRALAALASRLYLYRRHPILWLSVLLAVEAVLLFLLWGPLGP